MPRGGASSIGNELAMVGNEAAVRLVGPGCPGAGRVARGGPADPRLGRGRGCEHDDPRETAGVVERSREWTPAPLRYPMDMRTTSSGCSKASLASRRRLTCHSCHSGHSADAASIGNSWSSVVRSTVGWPTGRPRNFVIPNCADRPWRGSDTTPNCRTAIAWRRSGTSGGRPPGTIPVDRHSGASCAASRAAPKDLTTGRVTWSGPISTRCHRQQAGTLVRISSGPNVKQRSPFCGARCREFAPRRVLALTGGWINPFVKGLELRLRARSGLVEALGTDGTRPWVVAKHPMGKPEDRYVEESDSTSEGSAR